MEEVKNGTLSFTSGKGTCQEKRVCLGYIVKNIKSNFPNAIATYFHLELRQFCTAELHEETGQSLSMRLLSDAMTVCF